MPRQKRLNTIYISERLQEKLRPIAHSRLPTVVAPMGYGKTTRSASTSAKSSPSCS